MSLVYATKFEDTIFVFADTKISFKSENYSALSKVSCDFMKKYGVIKNYIFGGSLLFAFAGDEISDANEVIFRINNKTMPELLEIALAVHIAHNNRTDFIFGFVLDEIFLFQIKNGCCQEVNNCYIGHSDAFNYFQKIRHTRELGMADSNQPFSYEISGDSGLRGANESQVAEYEKLFNAFHKTIHDCGIKEVGGFVVPTTLDLVCKKLYRPAYNKNYSNFEIMDDGNTTNLLEMLPQKGAYSISFYGSHTNTIGIFISQGSLGILYNNYRIDSQDYKPYSIPQLSLPHSHKIHHIDFYTQVKAQGLKPPMWLDFDPSNIKYLWESVGRYKDEHKFELALIYINEIAGIINTLHLNPNDYDYILSEKKIIENKLR